MTLELAPKNATNFLFGIPLRSKAVSRSWTDVTRRFKNTLNSLLNQRHKSFRIVVAGHDIPDLAELSDPRVDIVRADYPAPIYVAEYMVDKTRKRELIGHHLRQLGGGYLMYVDDDDLVSNKIVEFVRSNPVTHGYIINRGYEYRSGEKKLQIAPRFNRVSGTCAISRWNVGDLPEVPFQRERVLFRDVVEKSHATWEGLFDHMNRPLSHLPFPGAVWVSHGENASSVLDLWGWRRKVLRAIIPYTEITPELRQEFCLPDKAN
jgi:hypothetical protein